MEDGSLFMSFAAWVFFVSWVVDGPWPSCLSLAGFAEVHGADASEMTRLRFEAFSRAGACNRTPSMPTVRCRSDRGSSGVRGHL